MHTGEKENCMHMFIVMPVKGKCQRVFYIDASITTSFSLHSSKQDNCLIIGLPTLYQDLKTVNSLLISNFSNYSYKLRLWI